MTFTPRLTDPGTSDLRWIQVNSGGYNQCIYGYYGAPSVLPNCTGYVHGRVMEIRGVNTDDSGLSFGNGTDYWNGSSSAWIKEQNPSLGAIVCYTEAPGSGQTYGHVAVVEQVIDNNTIVVSESNFDPPVRFRTYTCYRSYGWRPTTGWNVVPQGFLRNPYVDGGGGGTLEPSVLALLLKYIRKKKEEQHAKHITSSL